MFFLATLVLVLMTLLGLIGIFVTLKYPRPGHESFARKLEQRMFQRAFFSVAICLGGLVALLTRAFDPQDILIIAVASLILKEYMIIKVLPVR
ncbi:MAG: hypothetical protein QOF62_3068 [Pyrinomonadaceae bacterium]|jgi:hypothetical protein|nr:hypothetical protein [Pyrinomonadaceae bacterium]